MWLTWRPSQKSSLMPQIPLGLPVTGRRDWRPRKKKRKAPLNGKKPIILTKDDIIITMKNTLNLQCRIFEETRQAGRVSHYRWIKMASDRRPSGGHSYCSPSWPPSSALVHTIWTLPAAEAGKLPHGVISNTLFIIKKIYVTLMKQ